MDGCVCILNDSLRFSSLPAGISSTAPVCVALGGRMSMATTRLTRGTTTPSPSLSPTAPSPFLCLSLRRASLSSCRFSLPTRVLRYDACLAIALGGWFLSTISATRPPEGSVHEGGPPLPGRSRLATGRVGLILPPSYGCVLAAAGTGMDPLLGCRGGRPMSVRRTLLAWTSACTMSCWICSDRQSSGGGGRMAGRSWSKKRSMALLSRCEPTHIHTHTHTHKEGREINQMVGVTSCGFLPVCDTCTHVPINVPTSGCCLFEVWLRHIAHRIPPTLTQRLKKTRIRTRTRT